MGTATAIAGALPGIYVSKKKLYMVAALILVLAIIVIILAALLGKANSASARAAKESKGAGQGGDGKGTPSPTQPSSPLPTTPGTEAWWNVRLPKNVVPVHYNVYLNIILKELRFTGTSEIHLNVTQSTDLILVHSARMNVTSGSVMNKAGDQQAIKKRFWFEKNQFTVLQMETALEPGPYVVMLGFEAFLSDQLNGLYRSQYTHKDGKNVTIATTQFQPTDARKAFPCLDEPALKATFNITIEHRPDFIAISNMPIWKNETRNGRTVDHFEKTVVMPTYLLAMVVCDFGVKETKSARGVMMRYYAPPDKVEQLNYAASIGNKILDDFEHYYNISYPLPKADMIAIPDFAAGAMENWGLMTYRETALLWKEGTSSESYKQRVAAVIAHELAHQWFGNLVTMEWWDDLWLNEGFASFVEYKGVNKVEPTWGMDDQFVITDSDTAFSLDGLVSSHPIKVAVNHPAEINEIFDSISYNKGSCILRMLEDFLGENKFKKGLTRYLKRHAYGNAETDDLWKALKEESGQDVKGVMDTWTLQMGYPVVDIRRKNSSHVTVSQKHFLYDPNANVSASKYKSPYQWVIPFTYKTKAMPSEKKMLINKTSVDLEWDSQGWMKANFGQRGFYRVNYDDSNWESLVNELEASHTTFTVSDRAGILKDAFNLARGKMLNYTQAFETTRYLNKETEYVPWSAALSEINFISGLLSRSSPAYKYLQRYLQYQAKKQYDALGFKDAGSHLEKFQRSSILSIFCRNGEKSCVGNTTEMFKKWMEDPEKNPVPSNFRNLVYYYGVANGGVREWDFVYKQFMNTRVQSEAITLLYALSASKETWIIGRFLEYSLDPAKIRPQDATRVVQYVANYNPNGRLIAWDFVRLNWDTYKQRYGGGFFAFRNLILGVTSSFSTEYELNSLLKFNEKNKDPGSGARAQDQAVERVKANIKWLAENEKGIETWMHKFFKDNNIPCFPSPPPPPHNSHCCSII
ncbi:predicted protein [Nematostella vectensis]|uniref:Aminopeptidase n=1 Tax=Nematostella vectensis TaxID=45351 RepID=A7RL33_NEMVE|nr:predicted protein [Nematostella vectensis]|eukprot:XP_001639853.1 predicted protein [Nematostella vectensis]